MKLYNTLTKKVEVFTPNKEGEVKLYTCGPTVYNYAHIGNLRTYITEDILEKSLNYLGYNVVRCMNITDVGHLDHPIQWSYRLRAEALPWHLPPPTLPACIDTAISSVHFPWDNQYRLH